MPLQTILNEVLKDDGWDDFLSTQPKAHHEQTNLIQAETREYPGSMIGKKRTTNQIGMTSVLESFAMRMSSPTVRQS